MVAGLEIRLPRVVRRTRYGMAESARPSADVSRSTKRAPVWRRSTCSTKPVISAIIGRVSTGAATRSRAQPLRDEAGGHRREPDRQRERRTPACARRRRGRRTDRAGTESGDERGLAIGGQRQDRAGAGGDRQPERGPTPGEFLFERGGEFFAQCGHVVSESAREARGRRPRAPAAAIQRRFSPRLSSSRAAKRPRPVSRNARTPLK